LGNRSLTKRPKGNGNLEKLKARLVVRGFPQVYGMDYLDTFSPVAKLPSLRILLAIEDLEVHQMDVITAFLASDLEEEIYMDRPEGFKQGSEFENLVCLFKKGLYELKQAAGIWNQKIHQFLISIGLMRTTVYISTSTRIIIAMLMTLFFEKKSAKS
jgi:Reverse transcriptase (RNA-dependent DNA polymerase)